MNWYCSRSALKASLGISDTTDDTQIDATIELVSRNIDEHCGRWFYPRIQTRYFTPTCADHLLLDADLLGVTTLKTDLDADRVYETTWAATQYDLHPANAALEQIPQPYWRINVAPLQASFFIGWARSVQIVGSWGFYDVRERSSATLAEDLDTTELGVDVSSGSAFEVGQTILIDSEQMWISAIATNTLTVTRGVNGTTAATHTNGAAIDVYTYPVIGRLAVTQAAHVFRLKDAPGGMVGGSDFGGLRIAPNFHPIVWRSLETFRHQVFA